MPTHAEERIVPFTPQQMYELVADVDSYPEFLPWCVGARIRESSETLIVADLMIGYKMIRERFTSRVSLDREGRRVDVRYIEGPFRYLQNHWIFKEHEEGCLIDFYVDFEFKSRFLQRVIQPFFNEAVKRMVRAFETRAEHLYT